MNIQQINQIVSDYDALNQLAISKVDILKTIDPNEYSTYKGIEEIRYYDETVGVRCDDSSWGCYDQCSFEFPLTWLTKTDEELAEIVENERKVRLEKERIKRAEIDEKVRLEHEKKELKEKITNIEETIAGYNSASNEIKSLANNTIFK